MLAADLFDFQANIDLLEFGYDLGFDNSLFLHLQSSEFYRLRKLYLCLSQFTVGGELLSTHPW